MRADCDQLSAMREFVVRAVLALGSAPDLASDVELAADEAVTNVIEHGYGSQPANADPRTPGRLSGEIELAVAREGDDLVLRILDAAPEFDPTKAPSPDINAPLETRSPGGCGIHLIRQLMDDMTYRRLSKIPARGPEGLNELTLTKRGAFTGSPTAGAGSD